MSRDKRYKEDLTNEEDYYQPNYQDALEVIKEYEDKTALTLTKPTDNSENLDKEEQVWLHLCRLLEGSHTCAAISEGYTGKKGKPNYKKVILSSNNDANRETFDSIIPVLQEYVGFIEQLPSISTSGNENINNTEIDKQYNYIQNLNYYGVQIEQIEWAQNKLTQITDALSNPETLEKNKKDFIEQFKGLQQWSNQYYIDYFQENTRGTLFYKVFSNGHPYHKEVITQDFIDSLIELRQEEALSDDHNKFIETIINKLNAYIKTKDPEKKLETLKQYIENVSMVYSKEFNHTTIQQFFSDKYKDIYKDIDIVLASLANVDSPMLYNALKDDNIKFFQGVKSMHAEMKLLPKAINAAEDNDTSQNSIITSKLCCNGCSMSIGTTNEYKKVNIKTIGTHGKTYLSWNLPMVEEALQQKIEKGIMNQAIQAAKELLPLLNNDLERAKSNEDTATMKSIEERIHYLRNSFITMSEQMGTSNQIKTFNRIKDIPRVFYPKYDTPPVKSTAESFEEQESLSKLTQYGSSNKSSQWFEGRYIHELLKTYMPSEFINLNILYSQRVLGLTDSEVEATDIANISDFEDCLKMVKDNSLQKSFLTFKVNAATKTMDSIYDDLTDQTSHWVGINIDKGAANYEITYIDSMGHPSSQQFLNSVKRILGSNTQIDQPLNVTDKDFISNPDDVVSKSSGLQYTEFELLQDKAFPKKGINNQDDCGPFLVYLLARNANKLKIPMFKDIGYDQSQSLGNLLRHSYENKQPLNELNDLIEQHFDTKEVVLETVKRSLSPDPLQPEENVKVPKLINSSDDPHALREVLQKHVILSEPDKDNFKTKKSTAITSKNHFTLPQKRKDTHQHL